MDAEHHIDCMAATAESSIYLAETFPMYYPRMGPEVCATTYGCDMDFGETTTWTRPVADSIRDVLTMRPHLDTEYWNVVRAMTDLSIERGAGKWITALTDIHTNGDLLAALRDPQALALDYIDDFDGVIAACRHVEPHAEALYEDLYNRIAAAGLPSSTWGIAIARGRMYYVSCDFICMIGPEMFAETILPSIVRECRYLDRSIFHLDGPDALRHLDALLAIDELNAVQWTYGAGNEPAGRWIDVYRRIQDAGKGMEVAAVGLDDARTIMDHVKPEGVWLSISGQYDRNTAEAFLAEATRWAAGKR